MKIIIDHMPDNPELFIPSSLYPESEKLFALLGKDHLTVKDINEIKSIPIEFCLFGEDVPFGGRFQFFEKCAIWYDKTRKRYFGRKRDHKGTLNTNISAIGIHINDVYTKLALDLGEEIK